MSAGESNVDPQVKRRLERYEQVHTEHEERITRLERWKYRAQGGAEVLAIVLGSGVLGYIFL